MMILEYVIDSTDKWCYTT